MIKVYLTAMGQVKEYADSDEMEYTWQVGMAGELIIYYKKIHKVISMAEVDAGILTVWARDTWSRVNVIPE